MEGNRMVSPFSPYPKLQVVQSENNIQHKKTYSTKLQTPNVTIKGCLKEHPVPGRKTNMSEVRVAAKSSPSPTTSQTRVRVAVAVFLGFFLGRIYSDVRLDVFIVQTESSDSSTSSIASSLHDGDTPCDSSGLSPIPSLLDKRSMTN